MRQRAANGVRHLREDLPDVERFGDGMQQADERVDPFAPARLRRADGVVVQREREQVADRFEQLLMFVGERVRLTRRQPDGALHTRALPDGADHLRPLGSVARIVSGRRLRVADQMSCHLDLAGGADDIQRDRFGAIETQHVQPLERDRLAQQHGHARQRHVE